MNPFSRHRILLAFAATVLLAAGARAEAIFPVNENGTGSWVFDQPAVVANGAAISVAFVGDPTGSGLYKIYYAAVNPGADFTNKATVRSQVLLTPAVPIDNGSVYTNARHPRIALRSATQLVILFQAIPAGGTEYKLFRALLTLNNNALQAHQVSEIVDPLSGRMAGTLVDPSLGVVTTDNSLRVAYTDNTTGNVFYARVGSDNAFLAGSPILLSGLPGTQGVKPLPRLLVDGFNNSHIAWAANNSTATPSGIYYAMVKQSSAGVDSLGIGATLVLYGGNRWGFPTLLLPVTSTSAVLVLAADEPYGSTGIAGSLGVSLLSPYAVTQDGNPVNVNNVGANGSFFLSPPGGALLPSNFDVYRPETAIDGQNRLHVAGYGFLGGPPLNQGTYGRYYAMVVAFVTSAAGVTGDVATMLSVPTPVGTGNISFSTEIPGDYTRPAFVHYSGKAVLFWSGPDNGVAGARNLYVTSALDSTDNASTEQSGCAMVDDPRRGEAERAPGALLLFLPAALVGLRKLARKAFAR